MFTSLQTKVAEDTMLYEQGRCLRMRVPIAPAPLVGIAKALQVLCAPGRGRKPRGGLQVFGTTVWALSRTLQVPCLPWGQAMPLILQLAEPRVILGAL